MLYTGELESLGNTGIIQSFIAASNLPPNVTVEELTQLFDAAGLVSNIKILDIAENQADGSQAKTAIVGYYSDETARAALRYLHENMALSLERPLRLEYYGPIAMNEVEAELIKRTNMAILLNGIDSGH